MVMKFYLHHHYFYVKISSITRMGKDIMSTETYVKQKEALGEINTVTKKTELIRLQAIWFDYIWKNHAKHLGLTKALEHWKLANDGTRSPKEVETYFTNLT